MGGCGEGRGPCACPGGMAIPLAFHGIPLSFPPPGQAQGPHIRPTPPIVPTGRLTPVAAFGCQSSLGAGEEWMGEGRLHRPGQMCQGERIYTALTTNGSGDRNCRLGCTRTRMVASPVLAHSSSSAKALTLSKRLLGSFSK